MSKTIEIPKGYTPSRVEIKDGLVCLVFEPIETPKEFIPKDGDFCTATKNSSKWIMIFKNTEKDCHNYYIQYSFQTEGVVVNDWCATELKLTPATESEKQLLLSEIDKAGSIWNAEKKRIEKKRWRATKDHGYWYNSCLLNAVQSNDLYNESYTNAYKSGNYFQTQKQTTEAANLIEELLFHFHQNDEVLTKIKELLCVNN